MRRIFLLVLILAPSVIFAGPAYGVMKQSGQDVINPCKECGPFYVAYSMENHATLGDQKVDRFVGGQSKPVNESLRVFAIRQLTGDDLMAPREARIEKENGTFVLSTYRPERLEIGELKKSETMMLNSASTDDKALARVRMVWGDTFTVSSKSLQKGAVVKLVIHRTMGGFGDPITDYAFYHAISQTAVDGKTIEALNFDLHKQPGPANKDQVTGTSDTSYEMEIRVGSVFRVEGMLQVEDGLASDGKTRQMMNGADSVSYTISLPPGVSEVCVNSASGHFRSGACK